MPTEKKVTGYPSIDKPWLKYYTEEQINLALPKNTAYQYMRECNKNNLDACALEYLGKKITYRELFKNIDIVANCLLSMGVKKGDIITSCLANMPESAYLIYAANKLGVIIDLIDPFTVNETMANYCNNTQSKIVFTLDIAYKNVEKLPENTNIERIVLVSPTQSIKLLKTLLRIKDSETKKAYNGKNAISWDDFIKNDIVDSKKLAVDYEQNLPFAILHTGGTTGIPKGALLSVDNVNSLASQFKNSPLEMNNGETALNLMPPFAAYGLCNGLHLHLCCGMKVIMIPTYEPNKIVEQILKHKPNRIACAPAHYVHIAESEKIKSADLSFLKRPIVGGDTLNTKLEEELNELFAKAGCKDKITKGYGLTETASGICVCVNKAVNKIGSVGIPMAKNIVAAFSLSGEETECKYNEEGEICICSPNNMLGYYNKPEETEKVLKTHKDGKVWLHTGDLGYVDEDGNVFIKGRLKRMIIQYSGLKANPFEAEREILKNVNVNSVVVVGIKDPNHNQGQLPVAFVKTEEGVSVNEQDLIAELHKSCEDNITYYSVPVDYIIIDTYPRTPIGKIDFKELTNIYERDYKDRKILKQKELKF
ncbi:MAG: acyl--CoA ligase [Clostridia bacterium]|nr:acyl--CoA ligase [Clostridia bacterium]